MTSSRFSIPLAVSLLTGGAVFAQQPGAGLPASLQALNPDVSAIVDLNWYADDSREGLTHVLGELPGFGHAHEGGDDHAHHHHGFDEGFNLRHLEIQISAAVDPYFKGTAIAAIDTDGAEMEVAEIETTSLPGGLKVKAGKFFSDFGYLNAQHAHQWDFADQPLVYRLTLGDHGLNDKGAQLSWIAPTPFYLVAGLEAFQGDNERLFAYHGDDPFPKRNGPRAWVGWLKAGPNWSGRHALQVGLSAATGVHQEAHDSNGDGEPDHWLDGDSRFWGADLVYKYNDTRAYGQGDLIVQSEYFSRRKDLDLLQHDLAPTLAGRSRLDDQDGYYLQAVYGFLPRWRAGLRWEQVGLTNETDLPNGTSESHDDSRRVSGMVDFSPSEFSRLRFQVNRGRYAGEEGDEEVLEAFVQLVVSIGAHGAHTF